MIKIGQKAAGTDGPIEHLAACHRRIEERLGTLERAAEWIGSEDEAKKAEAIQAIGSAIAFLDSSGVLHTVDEEESLFPRLAHLLTPHEREYLDALERQHRAMDRAYAELKSALAATGAADRYRAAAARLADLYREHIASEDENLMPLASRRLSPEDLTLIAAEMKGRRQYRDKA